MKLKYMFIVCLFNILYAGDISGVYSVIHDGKESYTEIFKKNNKFYAVGFANKNKSNESQENTLDINNPNPELRTRPMRGVVFMWNLVAKNEKEYIRGKLYRFDNGKEYHVNAKQDGNILKLRISKDSKGTMGKTIQWRKMNLDEIKSIQAERLDIDTLELPQ
ncbi:DUF2147 domain-containing protein [Helicobacter didelphidarum]|uniref:DUF2147 domain-containing protein n=1 Tax=Helicobacter didelphidarum TaxID=2040648 RepID=A0A3D8IQM5_9HELI|nr:DUF2147 domain-containing protein [Helicobacter didelphidarum]RDU67597.1 DUF2147 domain-containing protein [Helicobacter didelphidarum]